MNENNIYGILGFFAFAGLLVVVGQVASRNLPKKQKTLRSKKFAAAGIALMAFSLPIFVPFVASSARTSYLDELKAENLNSIEEIAKFDKEQARNIERLKREVEDLREDLYETNRYYRFVLQMFSIAIVTVCIIFIFKKEESEQSETDQKTKI